MAAGGIGSPGPLDVKAGVILFSANLNVKNYPIGPELSAFLDRPVSVQNDVRVGGYAEFRLGAGRGYRDIIAAFVGTGIGGCVILGGEIVTGSTGNAGEIGHTIVKAGGPAAAAVPRAAWRPWPARPRSQRRVAKAMQKGTADASSARRWRAREAGSRAATWPRPSPPATRSPSKAIQRAAHYLGLGLGGLVNVLGPEIVIVGGGVVRPWAIPWVDLVRTSARAQILTDPDGQIKIVRAALGDDAGILGAALLAREHFLQHVSEVGQVIRSPSTSRAIGRILPAASNPQPGRGVELPTIRRIPSMIDVQRRMPSSHRHCFFGIGFATYTRHRFVLGVL